MLKSFKKPTILTTLLSFIALGAISAGIVFSLPHRAQAAPSDSQIMFVLDASSSMLYTDNTSSTRIDKAKKALVNTINSIPSDMPVGVRVYGSTVPENNQQAGCKDSVLLSSPKANNAKSLRTAINNVQAKGWTLIGKALQDVKGDFSGEGTKTVILLSDGIDTCNPSKVCTIAKELSKAGTNIKVNTVGIVVTKAAREQLKCVAQNTGGTYYDVNNIDRLQKALQALTSREVNKVPAQKGIPIRGTEDLNDAPIMLNNTLYSDTLVDKTLYYGFDALPEQKIKVTVTGTDTGDQLDWFNYLQLRSYSKLDGQTLAATAIFGTSKRFTKSADTVTLTYTIDTKQQKITEAQPVAFGLAVTGTQDKNIKVPIDIKVTTEGGIAPDNKSVDSEAQTAAQKSESSTESASPLWPIIAGILVALLIAGGISTYFYLRKKNRNNMPPTNTL